MTKTRTGGCSFFAMAHRGWGPRRGETGVDPLGGRGRAEVVPAGIAGGGSSHLCVAEGIRYRRVGRESSPEVR